MRNLGLASVVLVVVACDGRSHSLGRPHHAHHEAGDGGDDNGVGGARGLGGVLGGRSGLVGTGAGGKGGLVSRGGASGNAAGGSAGTSGDRGDGGDSGESVCGDRVTVPPEECDDGNSAPGDGCSAMCRLEVGSIATGTAVTCAVSVGGSAKCWGINNTGQLGLGLSERDEMLSSCPTSCPGIDLGTGRRVESISPGYWYTCAVLDEGTVKCWGFNGIGQLGLGDTENRGENPGEMGDLLPAVDLGGRASIVASGGWHACALLGEGAVKCWGSNRWGELGLGDTENRGDDPGQMGDNLPAVDLGTGRRAVAISLGYMHTCAILDDGSVKCWGGNGFGQLGLGDAENRGDEPLEMGDALRTVDLGAGRRAAQIVAGFGYTCALLDDGSVKCWGDTSGYDALAVVGTDPFDMGDNLVAVNLGIGRRTVALAAGGGDHTCALLDDGSVKCWGFNDLGQLGLGDIENRGDEPGEMGDNLPAVDLGTRQRVTQVVAGWGPTCTLHDDRSLRCWGHHHGDEPGEMGENLPTVEVGF